MDKTITQVKRCSGRAGRPFSLCIWGKTSFITSITNYLDNNTISVNIFNGWFQKTKLFIKNHPESIVTNLDKGNVSVIIYL